MTKKVDLRDKIHFELCQKLFMRMTSHIIMGSDVDKIDFFFWGQNWIFGSEHTLSPFHKDLPTYYSYRYQGKSSCVGHGVSKVGERKGLR